MQVEFYKYQGTGNDFVVIDGRNIAVENIESSLISQLCDRKFGIGADGLMILRNHRDFDFEMLYYNANGWPGSMCGNGGRCMVAFAQYLGILQHNKAYFLAVDGPHDATISPDGLVALKMIDVTVENFDPAYMFLDTGSPHHIEFINNLDEYDVYSIGKAIRNNEKYKEKGTNVNFVEVLDRNQIKVATYERGVEDETLSCGTGVTAAAIAYQLQHASTHSINSVGIQTKGGVLEVAFKCDGHQCTDIWLKGPAKQVFKGVITI